MQVFANEVLQAYTCILANKLARRPNIVIWEKPSHQIALHLHCFAGYDGMCWNKEHQFTFNEQLELICTELGLVEA